MPARVGQLCVNIAAREQAVVTNLDEAVGEYVEKEAANKLLGRDGDALAVLGAKANAARVERDDAVVGDADSMGVLAEVLEDLLGAGERSLRVGDPVLAKERVLQPVELRSVGQDCASSAEIEFATLVRMGQCVENLPRKSGESTRAGNR